MASSDEHYIQQQREEHAHISNVAGKKVFNIDSDGNVINYSGVTVYQGDQPWNSLGTTTLGATADVTSNSGVTVYQGSQPWNSLGTVTPATTIDPMLEIALGNVPGTTHVNKFGRAVQGVQTTATDIWDRADATPTQQIWIAPTQARSHILRSNDAGDDDGAGGARTIQIYGLNDWDTAETSEVVTMNGTATVATASQYTIIHRMKVITSGASAINMGTITAISDGDNTVTAQINPQEGQTQMAIYGIPSTQTAYMTNYYGTVNRSAAAAGTVNFSLVFNPNPDAQLKNFQVKNTRGLQSTGNSSDTWENKPYAKYSGPGIFKVQGIASAADIEASAGFDLILVNN